MKTSLTASAEGIMPVLVITGDELRAVIADNAVVKLNADTVIVSSLHFFLTMNDKLSLSGFSSSGRDSFFASGRGVSGGRCVTFSYGVFGIFA